MRTKPIQISFADLYRTARARPAGYVKDVLEHALWTTETHYALDEEDWRELREKYTTPWKAACRECRDEFCDTFRELMIRPCCAKRPKTCPQQRF